MVKITKSFTKKVEKIGKRVKAAEVLRLQQEKITKTVEERKEVKETFTKTTTEMKQSVQTKMTKFEERRCTEWNPKRLTLQEKKLPRWALDNEAP